MVELPRIRPEIAASSGWRATVKRSLTGARHVTIEDVRRALPSEIASQTLQPTARTELLSVPFRTDDYYIRVFTEQNARLHRWLMWWRNFVCSRQDIETPVFTSHDSGEAFAQYQYEALRDAFADGGHVPEPITVETTDTGGIVVTRRVDTKAALESADFGADEFQNAVRTLKTFHKNGYQHGDVPANLFQRNPTGRVLMTNPIGKASDDHIPEAHAYDLIGTMVLFTPTIGAWAVAQRVFDEYPLGTFEHLAAMATTLDKTQSRMDSWTVARTAEAVGKVLYEETGRTPADIAFDPDEAGDSPTFTH